MDMMDSISTEGWQEKDVSTPTSPPFYIHSTHLRRATELKVHLQTLDSSQPMAVDALLDSGATGMFIDREFVKAKNLTTQQLPRPIPLYNINGTLNDASSVREEVDLLMHFSNHSEKSTFAVTSLGRVPLIVGHTWLVHHNPEINWSTGKVAMTRCPEGCGLRRFHSLSATKHPERSPNPLHSTSSHDLCQLPNHLCDPSPSSTDRSGDTCQTNESGVRLLGDRQATPSANGHVNKGSSQRHHPVSPCPHPAQPSPFEELPDVDWHVDWGYEHGEDYIPEAFLHPGDNVRATESISTRLAIEQHKKTFVKKPFEEMVPKQYHDFRDVFAKESFDRLPPRRPWDHAIELKENVEPPGVKLYPLSLNEQKEMDAFLTEHLESGRIRPSKSPIAAPVFFVKKKDGGLRFVQDYRKLNAATVKNVYPLPLVTDILNRVAQAKFFTKLDVRWGYNNIRMREGDEWKAAFRTNRGLFEPLVMFFGLTNSPATFQTMMNHLFKDLVAEGVVAVYMDDILVFTETLEQHYNVVRRVLQILRENNLFLKAEKCTFGVATVEYLGLILSPGQVAMDPVKVAGVRDWPSPKTVKEVQSFLGFVNFYRRFIENFSHIAHPLHHLTRKDEPWKWTNEHQDAFTQLKGAITSTPILVHPDADRPYRLEADSSDFATGAVLSQLRDDDKWHPVGFISKTLNDVERNYEIHDKELLAIIRGLQEFRHLLEGAAHQVEIITDHRNLLYFMTAQSLNRRQARWSLFLSRFDFRIIHRPGKSSTKPDALSHRADHHHGEGDNRDQILLPPKLFHIKATGSLPIQGLGADFQRRIRDSKDLDESVAKAVKELNTSDDDGWAVSDGLILLRGKVYVPRDRRLRHDIVRAHHDTPVAGHPGRWKTVELVTRNYWWPGITQYIADYVRGCDRCNRTKTFPAMPVGKLQPNRIPDHRWQIVTTDFITGLPPSRGYNAIWVVVDRLSKRMHAIPTTEEVDSLGLARLYRDHVWKHHGLPEEVISDRGPQFASLFMKELNRLLGIHTALSTAYHPQTDGQTERVNQEIEQYLRLFINERQDDWYEWMALAEFTYNNRIHSATRHSPFELDTGQHPRIGTEPNRETRLEAVDEFVKRMKQATEEAKSALRQAASDMARFYDTHRQTPPEYAKGDKVWLDAENITTTRPTKKFDDKWFGPFPIDKVISPTAYRLKLTRNFQRIHPVFHVSKLRPFQADTILERHQPPPPKPVITTAGDTEYEVENILDSRLHRAKLQYLVKWKGYGPEENSWEPESNLANSKKLLDQFHHAHPNSPRRIAAAIWDHLPFTRFENFTEVSTRHLFDWTQGKLVGTPSPKRGVMSGTH